MAARTLYVMTTEGSSSATWLALGVDAIQKICEGVSRLDSWLTSEDEPRGPTGMVDAAVGQALVGDERLEQLITAYGKRGWRVPVRWNKQAKQARGVGGSVDIIGEALIPVTVIPGHCVLILFKIVSGEIPLLLPATWLEKVDANIDLETGEGPDRVGRRDPAYASGELGAPQHEFARHPAPGPFRGSPGRRSRLARTRG